MGVFVSRLIDVRKLGKVSFFRTPAESGLITGVAAGTGSAGHLFCFRNPSASVNVFVTRVRFRWRTTVGFTAAQEMALQAFKVTAYSVDHSGGTAVTPLKRRRSASPTPPASV